MPLKQVEAGRLALIEVVILPEALVVVRSRSI